ncbi:MAG: MMPL family transporter [Myxococcota bacterium]|nr:MMPL family transporter [Myxococcota bacterium]
MLWLAKHAVGHPRRWLVGVAIVTLAAAAGLPQLELRTEGRSLYPLQSAVVIHDEHDATRFEDSRELIVLVGCRGSKACLALPQGLRDLRRIHDSLAALPGVRGHGLESLAGLVKLERRADGLAVDHHLANIPPDPEAFAGWLATLRQFEPTDGLLLAKSGRLAALYVPLAEDREVREIVAELHAWAASQSARTPSYTLRLTGPTVAETTLGSLVLSDLAVLVPFMLLVIAGLLFLIFRDAAGIAIPLAESGIVLVWTLGAMGWTGVPVTLVTTVLPVVLMAISITDEIHLLERFRSLGPGLPVEEAVIEALQQVGPPIVMTSVTTAFGFLAFLSAGIEPLRDFGIFASLGILAAMLLSFCWIPALLVSLPSAWRSRDPVGDTGSGGPGLSRFSRWTLRRPGLALTVGCGVLVVCLPGLSVLRVQDSWIDNFDPRSELATAERDFNDNFWGSYRFDIVLTAEPDYFYSSAGIASVIEVLDATGDAPHLGGTLSYLTPLSEVARSLDDNLTLLELPERSGSDLSSLAEMAGGSLRLRQLLTDAGDAARIRLFVQNSNYERSLELRNFLEDRLQGIEGLVDSHFSGDLPVAGAVVEEVVRGQLRSIGWVFACVALSLILFFRSPRGLIAMIPVCATTTALLGAMGILGFPLGIATSMFASLALGVGVDFGIHFLHGYQHERVSGRDDRSALEAMVAKAGSALRWNVVVLALGFASLCFSNLKPNHSLGLLLASSILLCFLATFSFLPRLARFVPGLALVFLVVGISPDASADCAPDEATTQIMRAAEAQQRDGDRIVHVKISDTRKAMSDKTLWGVFSSDEEKTEILYVFSGPGRLAGTTLLIRDFRKAREPDEMWLYLPALRTFTKLVSRARRMVVPGTVLTYSDSRGYLPVDLYHFGPGSEDSDPGKPVVVRACPRDDQIAEELGYTDLRIVVDTAKNIVRELVYEDSAGPLKHYRLHSEQQLGGHWRPSRVTLENLRDGGVTLIDYRYWPAEPPPPDTLFEARVEPATFLGRLEPYLEEAGLEPLIAPELERARRHIRAWNERWGNTVPPK